MSQLRKLKRSVAFKKGMAVCNRPGCAKPPVETVEFDHQRFRFCAGCAKVARANMGAA
jgi:hypothetical protein